MMKFRDLCKKRYTKAIGVFVDLRTQKEYDCLFFELSDINLNLHRTLTSETEYPNYLTERGDYIISVVDFVVNNSFSERVDLAVYGPKMTSTATKIMDTEKYSSTQPTFFRGFFSTLWSST